MAEVYARYDRATGRKQLLKDHCDSVGQLCSKACFLLGLSNLGLLAGLLHDGGKCSSQFQEYLFKGDSSQRGSINHSSFGAQFVAKEFADLNACTFEGITAALIAGASCGHHGGPFDYVNPRAKDELASRITPKKDIHYDEVKQIFFAQCYTKDYLSNLFQCAVAEVENFSGLILSTLQEMESTKSAPWDSHGQQHFFFGLTERFLLSALIDADRFDAYCFSANVPPVDEERKNFSWKNLLASAEEYCSALSRQATSHAAPSQRELIETRRLISELCLAFASRRSSGVYTLNTQTGSGKTLSVLLFTLTRAVEAEGVARIIYVAPYKVILDQTALAWRKAVGDSSVILEHHSDFTAQNAKNVAQEKGAGLEGGTVTEEDKKRFELLTQRWSKPLIITTMVQFLQTLFSSSPTCTRRFQSLAHSVIVLDEIQSVPLRFMSMLNASLNFLSKMCNCTIVLCTATPPSLSHLSVALEMSEPSQIIPDDIINAPCFRRVTVEDKTATTYTSAELADFVLDEFDAKKQVLVILNTKRAVEKLFDMLAAQCSDGVVYCLSTNLCTRHRRERINEIKQKLNNQKGNPVPLICVSTPLIEAGIDISFPCVIRSLTGLDSIAQSAGRCNRHHEITGLGTMFVVRCSDENLTRLPEIEQGRQATETVFYEFKKHPDKFGGDLISPAAVQLYYQTLYKARGEDAFDYPVKKEEDFRLYKDSTLYDLLSKNNSARGAITSDLPRRFLWQAFGTAGDLAKPIEYKGMEVVVPYGGGAQVIERLKSSSLKDLPALMEEAQQYTVSIYEYEKEKFLRQNGLSWEANSGALVLDSRFYYPQKGVQCEPLPMELLIAD